MPATHAVDKFVLHKGLDRAAALLPHLVQGAVNVADTPLALQLLHANVNGNKCAWSGGRTRAIEAKDGATSTQHGLPTSSLPVRPMPALQ